MKTNHRIHRSCSPPAPRPKPYGLVGPATLSLAREAEANGPPPTPSREPLCPPQRPAEGWSRWAFGLALAIGLFAASTTRALEIELIELTGGSYVPMTLEQRTAFRLAANLWEAAFFEAIPVKLKIGFRDLGSDGILGSTHVNMTTHTYADVRKAMHAFTRGSELLAMKKLPPGPGVPVVDFSGSRYEDLITMTTANAMALGIGIGVDPDYGAYGGKVAGADAIIRFNINYPFQYQRNVDGSIDEDKHDFIAVAAHEIGHALGFFSGVDAQEANRHLALHPSPLDLWRFEQTGGAHNITTEARWIKNGPAEYYDSPGSTREFSRGFCDPVMDLFCGGRGCGVPGVPRRCQASHWRDNARAGFMDPTLGLMDPTLQPGSPGELLPSDIRAMDYIGYDNFVLDFIPYELIDWRCIFGDPCVCPPQPPFDGYPWFPDPIRPTDFQPNVGMVLGLTFPADLGGIRRSGVGFALFQEATPGPFPVIEPLPDVPGVENLLPAREPMDVLPPRFTEFHFVSDRIAGVPFTARSMLSKHGAQFDPGLGQSGGYHICLAIDGEADGVVGDIDAMVTIELLADARGVPDPAAQNVFQIAPNQRHNSFRLLDPEALGFCDPSDLRVESETNNTPETAHALGSVSLATVLGTITAGDVDYYRFTAPSNSRVWITVDTGGPQSAEANARDSFVTLYGTDGVTVIEADDDDGSGNGGDGTLESDYASAIAGRTLAAGGTYYVAVRAYRADQIVAPYRLLLTVTSRAYDPEVESNDQDYQADRIVSPAIPSGVRSGIISGPNDPDYYSVTVSGRSLLHVSADGDPNRSGFGTDIVVDLIAPDGVTPLFTANSSAAGVPGNPPAEGFCYVVPSAGTYFVRVRGVEQAQGPYHLMVASCRAGQPRLTAKAIGTNVLVTWPADSYGYRLQSSGDMRSWEDVTLVPSLSSNSLGVTVPAGTGKRFFRLISP